jgi:hypothetical protein
MSTNYLHATNFTRQSFLTLWLGYTTAQQELLQSTILFCTSQLQTGANLAGHHTSPKLFIHKAYLYAYLYFTLFVSFSCTLFMSGGVEKK